MGCFVRFFGDWDHCKARTQDHEEEHEGNTIWAAARCEASKRAAAAREEYIVNMFEGKREGREDEED